MDEVETDAATVVVTEGTIVTDDTEEPIVVTAVVVTEL